MSWCDQCDELGKEVERLRTLALALLDDWRTGEEAQAYERGNPPVDLSLIAKEYEERRKSILRET